MNARDKVLMLLCIDPADVGCDHVIEVMDLFVELVLKGEDPEGQLPGVSAHLLGCPPCGQDVEGLLAAIGA